MKEEEGKVKIQRLQQQPSLPPEQKGKQWVILTLVSEDIWGLWTHRGRSRHSRG